MRHLLSLSLLMLALTANARQITSDEALAVAQDFFNGSTVEQSRAPRTVLARTLDTTQSEDIAPYYIFNASDNSGFVIISGDDRVAKVLGYSDKYNCDITNMPPQLSAMLDRFAERLSKLHGSATDQSWTAPRRAASTDAGVLLETANWGQGAPYNNLCPVIDGVRCPTGCCATAMSIIMDYYQWPDIGRGSRNMCINGIDHNIDFEDYPFNWNAVHNKNYPYEESVSDELARILYAAAIADLTNFNTQESTAEILGIAQSLNYYFRYGNCQLIMKDFRTSDEWEQIIKQQIDNSSPIICGALGSASHAFICDGYRNNDEFHINWGWDGQFNGYYSFELMNPGPHYFSNDFWAIIDINPSHTGESPSTLWLSQYGLSIDVADVTKGKPFNTRTMRINDNLMLATPFKGEGALCLVDWFDNIIEFIKVIPLDFVDEYGSGGPASTMRFTDCIIKSDISPDYKLKLFSRETGSDAWNPIHGSIDCVSEISVVGNELRFTPVSWNIPSDVFLQTELEEYAFSAYWDADYHVRLFFPYEEMLTVYVNDRILQPSHFDSEYCPYPQVGYYFDNALNINIRFDEEYKEAIDFKVVTTPLSSLKDETISLAEPNKIQDCMQAFTDPLQIGTLHISGNISQQDVIYLLVNCPNLRHLDLSETKYFNYDGTPCNTLQSGLFNICLHLEELSLPNNIRQLEGGSIQRCYRLRTLHLPSSVETVAVKALDQCHYLHHVTYFGETLPSGLLEAIKYNHISADSEWYDPIKGCEYCTLYVNNAIYNSFSPEHEYGKSIKIVCNDTLAPIAVNDGLITYSNFGNDIYVGCKHVGEPSGNSKPYLSGELCFRESFNGIPVRYILQQSFSDFSEIRSLVFPDALSIIGQGAFMNCIGIENIDFPESIQRVEASVFWNCENIKEIYVRSNVPFFLDNDAFPESAFSAKLYVPYGTKDLYKQADVWRNFYDIEEFDSSGISEVEFDATVQSISLYNLQGIKIFQGNASHIPDLPSGVYLKRAGSKVVKVVL